MPRRSQRTRAVLTFFAQDHASADMVYSNADITKTEQAAEIIAFADYWNDTTGSDPGLLVFDSQAHHLQDPRPVPPAAASPGSPCASAARPNSPASAPFPPQRGRPPPSPGPAATGAPACTKT